jgi:hypothetical protein
MLVDAEGATLRKLRKQRNRFKVYGDDLAALGYVEWSDDEPASIEMTALETGETSTIKPVDPDDEKPTAFEMPGHFRIEKTRRGWAVFDQDREPLGIFEKLDEGGWQLRSKADAPDAFKKKAVFRVETADAGPATVTRDGKTIAHVRIGELSPLELLALQLPGLAPIEQVAVGAWLRLNPA